MNLDTDYNNRPAVLVEENTSQDFEKACRELLPRGYVPCGNVQVMVNSKFTNNICIFQLFVERKYS